LDLANKDCYTQREQRLRESEKTEFVILAMITYTEEEPITTIILSQILSLLPKGSS
jgi:hypothetical protein